MSVSALASTAVNPPRERGSHSQLVTGRMRSPMLFLYSFPDLLATRGLEARRAWKEFQGEPRDTGSPNSSLPVLGAPRSLPPSPAGVGSASSWKQQPLFPAHHSSRGPGSIRHTACKVPIKCRHPRSRPASPTVTESLQDWTGTPGEGHTPATLPSSRRQVLDQGPEGADVDPSPSTIQDPGSGD